MAVAIVLTVVLVSKSARDFSRTGPQIRREIANHYAGYAVWCVLRLGLWSFLLATFLGLVGAFVYACLIIALDAPFHWAASLASSVLALVGGLALQLCRQLLYLPSLIVSSSHYRISRFYPLWRRLSPARLRWVQGALGVLAGLLAAWAGSALALEGRHGELAFFVGVVVVLLGIPAWATLAPEPRALAHAGRGVPRRPNIVMIGSDSLRADRLGLAGYRRPLTPNIDALAARGTAFLNCFVPLARTAPSLASLLSGTWPHNHGIRDNYVPDTETTLAVPALARLLRDAGYETAAVADWAGSDLRKLSFGFERTDVPEDQWNFKYMLRQGPKDIRFFLSLFCHNRFGKTFLPELYYLAGVPQTRELGRSARHLINKLAKRDKPFFLTLFTASTHAPFGSPYPYYQLFTQPDYDGESKFTMVRLNDPQDIIESQRRGKHDFDCDQIANLYDGCVRSFDDEVGRVLSHIRACGLEDNTIVVLFSDHGLDLFEKESWGQGNTVFGNDASARVPVIVSDPRRGQEPVVEHTVRSIDLAPTLLELLDLERPAHLDGRSLVPYLARATEDMGLEAFTETGLWLTRVPGMPAGHLAYPSILELLDIRDKKTGTLSVRWEFAPVVIEAKDRMMRDDRWKLIYQPLEGAVLFKLFDLRSDPECEHDVCSAYPEVERRMEERLVQWILDDPVMTVQDGRMVAVRVGGAPSPVSSGHPGARPGENVLDPGAIVASLKR